MQKKIILITILILCLPLVVRALGPSPGVAAYNLEQCIAIALEKHPSINASVGAIKANESKVGQAKANYYPQVNLSTSYQRIGPASSYNGNNDPYNQYSTSVDLGMTLFDFGKTSTQVKIQNLNVNASRADYDDVRTKVALNVKNAYYNLLQNQRNLDVAMDTVKQYQQHLEQANAFFRIGTKPKFDVTKAEVDFGNARLNVLKAENADRKSVV